MGKGIFKRRLREVPLGLEDEVVPAHIFDDFPDYRRTLMAWTFQFNDVLDPDKLHESLCKLISEGENWRKVGGRIRLNKAKKIEIHIPRPFTAERPPVRFSKSTMKGRLAEHPVASQLPSLKANGVSSTFLGPQSFTALGPPDDAPKCFQDYLDRDEPQLSLHVCVLVDATLVSMQFLHTMTDALGLAALMRAWQAVLGGNMGAVPPLQGLKEDPMAAFYDAEPTEKHVQAKDDLRNVWLLVFIMRYIWRRLGQGDFETRTICLTPRALETMRSTARSQLPKDDPEGAPAFISEGDILAGWIGRLSALASRSGKGPVTLVIPVDVRGRAREVFPEGTASVQNAILVVYAPLAKSLLRGGLLGTAALEVRRAIGQQTTRAQFNALARLAFRSMTKSNHPPLMCKTGSVLVSVTNWTKTGFLGDIDFSAAVVKPGPGSRPGRVVYYHTHFPKDPFFTSPMCTIMGKDPQGNYWLTGHLPARIWPAVEEQLADFEKQDSLDEKKGGIVIANGREVLPTV